MKLRLLALLLALPAAAPADSARQNWENHCVQCHGEQGDGRTPQGRKFHVKDYTRADVQDGFTDAGLLKDLLLGVSDPDDRERMPAFKSKLTLTEARDLVAYIRTLRK